ncbi:Photosystem II assembly protein [Acaryochloris thomasi RCC1774]|uniref:Photosystem II assembly protein n=1 Tax=Acaryochloris thomasi RCC1774 TaxID=1764569 RepID=A0A2W1JY66_9CYAN|nr:tetratricopeptide repeat protein [Acaryochloris thomasi]PZD73521.1 Photosystem II assembly protein [Acaryochloris thomasi RCC1774]
MQHLLNAQAEAKRSHWLNHVEMISVVGSVGGAIASAVTNQVVFASIPLSLTATLHLANRRRLTESAGQVRQLMIAQISQQDQERKAQIETLTQNGQKRKDAIATLTQQDEDKQLSIEAITKQNQAQQNALETMNEKLEILEEHEVALVKKTEELQADSDSLREKEQSLATALEQLHQIDLFTQIIRATPRDATLYYRRGLVRGSLCRLDDQRIAIDDYSQAIALDPDYADAYFQRGALRGTIDEKKHAVADLRIAAKLYFEAGDLEHYDEAMSLSQEQHELAPAAVEMEPEAPSESQSDEPLVIGSLFD